MRWRVAPGAQVARNGAVYVAGEEFDATAKEAEAYEGLVEKVPEPKSSKGD